MPAPEARLRPSRFAPFLVAAVLLAASPARAQHDDEPTTDDRPASPYFFVRGGDPDTDRLPLKDTSAEVRVVGVIAHVRVRQVFANEARRPIEAVYVFPASTRAAVHGMRMKIGARVIEARIDRKVKAREDYEQARAEGKRAGLLEQQRPNVFQTSVANVMPGDRLEVQLDYSELLVPEKGVYELVYPAVVGPRYPGRGDTGTGRPQDRWMATAHLPEGEPEPYTFDVRVHLETGVALTEVTSPSHGVAVDRLGPSGARVRLVTQGGGDRDYVLRWRLAGDRIQTGALLAPPDERGDGYFAVMLEPPRRSTPADMPPREFVFLVDVSGSMHGFPLDTTKALMRTLLGGLRPVDAFNVVLFSGGARVLAPTGSVPATPENLRVALGLLGREQGGGGTELLEGLRTSYALPRADGRARTVVVVTDGYVGVEAEAFRFVRQRLGEANLFAFGIGAGVNRHLVESLARAGYGEPFIVAKPEEAATGAERFRAYIDRPLLTDIQVRFTGLAAFDVAPAKLPDLLAERPLVLFGKYRGSAEGRVEITGRTGHGVFRQLQAITPGMVKPEAVALRWLWARKQAAWLEDELAVGAKEAEEALTQIGLRYTLLTSTTSFVAVDHVVANTTGDQVTANQPLPLPAGVSRLAVGAAVSVSRSVMPPGDPILTVRAPGSARLVTAYFPFGLVKDLHWDPFTERWQTRFLVPNTVADGLYQVPVTILHADGRLETTTAQYQIDSAAPDFEVALEPADGGVTVRVRGAEALRRATVALVAKPRVRVELAASHDGSSFEGFLALPPGLHRLRVVVADQARNEAEHLLPCEVER